MIIRAALVCLSIVIAVETFGQCQVRSIKQQLADHVNSAAFVQYANQHDIALLTTQMYFAVYDHNQATAPGEITFYEWDRPNLAPKGLRRLWSRTLPAAPEHFNVYTPKKVDGVPEVPVKASTNVWFALANTQPLLYKVSKEIDRKPVAALADLQAIVKGLGGIVGSVVSAAAERDSAQVNRNNQPLWIDPPASPLSTLRNAATAAENLADDAEKKKQHAIAYLTVAEHVRTPNDVARSAVAAADYTGFVVKATQTIRDLESAASDFRATDYGRQYSCSALKPLADRAVALNWAVTNATRQSEVTNLQADAALAGCDSIAVQHFADVLNKSLDRKDAELVRQYVRTLDATTRALSSVKAVLDKRGDILTAAASLQNFGSALATASPAGQPCDLIAGMIVATPDTVDFTTEGTVKATVAEVAPFGATYPRRANATPTAQFRIANAIASRIGVGVGLVHTSVDEPTYKPVTDPTDASRKVIGKISEETRSGQLGLFASYRFGEATRAIRPGIQLGVGVRDTPQLFTGVSFDLGRYVRVGAGATAQRIKDLSGGQRSLRFIRPGEPDPDTLTVIADENDIRYRTRHVVAPYVSLSVSIDGMSFWSRQ